MKNLFKKFIEKVKKEGGLIKEYFVSLKGYQKVFFILIVILCKLGPDLITFPLLLKYINSKMDKKNKENN